MSYDVFVKPGQQTIMCVVDIKDCILSVILMLIDAFIHPSFSVLKWMLQVSMLNGNKNKTMHSD